MLARIGLPESPNKIYIKKIKNGLGIRTVDRNTGAENILFIMSESKEEDGNNKKIKVGDPACNVVIQTIQLPAALAERFIFVIRRIQKNLEPCSQKTNITDVSGPLMRNKQKPSFNSAAKSVLARNKGVHLNYPSELNMIFVDNANKCYKMKFTANPIVMPQLQALKNNNLYSKIDHGSAVISSSKFKKTETKKPFLRCRSQIPVYQYLPRNYKKVQFVNKLVQTERNLSIDQCSQTNSTISQVQKATQTELGIGQYFMPIVVSSQKSFFSYGKTSSHLKNIESDEDILDNSSQHTVSQDSVESLKTFNSQTQSVISISTINEQQQNNQMENPLIKKFSSISNQEDEIVKSFEKNLNDEQKHDFFDNSYKIFNTSSVENNLSNSNSYLNTNDLSNTSKSCVSANKTCESNTSTIASIKNCLNATSSLSLVELMKKRISKESFEKTICSSEESSIYIEESQTEPGINLDCKNFENRNAYNSTNCLQINSSTTKSSNDNSFIESKSCESLESLKKNTISFNTIKTNSDLTNHSESKTSLETPRQDTNESTSSKSLCERCGSFFVIADGEKCLECSSFKQKLPKNNTNELISNKRSPLSLTNQRSLDTHIFKNLKTKSQNNNTFQKPLNKMIQSCSDFRSRLSHKKNLKMLEIGNRSHKVELITNNANSSRTQFSNINNTEHDKKKGHHSWYEDPVTEEIQQQNMLGKLKIDQIDGSFHQNDFKTPTLVSKLQSNSYPFMDNIKGKKKSTQLSSSYKVHELKINTAKCVAERNFQNEYNHYETRCNRTILNAKQSSTHHLLEKNLSLKELQNTSTKTGLKNKFKSWNSFKKHIKESTTTTFSLGDIKNITKNVKPFTIFKHNVIKNYINEPMCEEHKTTSKRDFSQNVNSLRELRFKINNDSHSITNIKAKSVPNFVEFFESVERNPDKEKRALFSVMSQNNNLKEINSEATNINCAQNPIICAEALSYFKKENLNTELGIVNNASIFNITECLKRSNDNIEVKAIFDSAPRSNTDQENKQISTENISKSLSGSINFTSSESNLSISSPTSKKKKLKTKKKKMICTIV